MKNLKLSVIFALLLTLLTLSAGYSSTGAVSSSFTPPSPAVTTETAQDRKERTVYITRTGEKYHLGSCRYLRQSKIAIKLKDAIAQGYTACKVCRP